MSLRLLFLAMMTVTLAACGGGDLGGGDREVSDFGNSNSPGSVTVTGSSMVGETLTAQVSDPDGVQASTINYQWFADGNPIAGATGASYTLTPDDARALITVSVQYTDDNNLTTTTVSAGTTAQALNAAPTLSVEVPADGALVGQVLTAALMDANGFGTVTYQWIGSVTGPIDGETGPTLTLTNELIGQSISVSASYTDDDSFAESLTSAVVGPVVPPSAAGSVAISGVIQVGNVLTATVVDGDGFSTPANINFVWSIGTSTVLADVTTDQTTNDYLLQPAQLGLPVTVTATYLDADASAEAPTATTFDFIHSFVVNNEAGLVTAVGSAASGDIIGLGSAGGGDYEDMAELEIGTDNITLRRINGSTAVITGSTCLVYGSSTTGVRLDNLVFDDLSNPNTSNCGEGEGSIRLQGDANFFSNNQILGQIDVRPSHIGGSDELHYMTIGGTNNVVERNLFEGLPTTEAEEGAAISMFISAGNSINESNGSNEGNIVQYNLFRNFLPDATESDDPTEWDTDSNGFAIQVGRSGSGDGLGLGAHVIQYNRFDAVLNDRRIILVQGGGNVIHGNTIVNSWGNIALEHGYDNTVSSNIILSNGSGFEAEFGGMTVSDNLDGGISFVPLGHTIIDNFVGNVASSSSDRAGLHIDSETIEPSDSSSIDIINSGLDLTNVVARNSFVNVRQAIQFEHDANESGVENCENLDYILDFDDNLVANQSSGASVFGTSAGASRTAIILDDYPGHGCGVDPSSSFTNTRIYSQTISDEDIPIAGGGIVQLDGVNGNTAMDSSEDGATLTAPDANGLVEGAGPDAGIGADIDALNYIDESMVGPGSTWVAP